MRNILLSILLLAVTLAAEASKARGGKITVTLRDGTRVMLTLRGDEHRHFYTTDDGRLAKRDGKTWRLATEEETAAAKAAPRRAPQTLPIPVNSRPFPHIGTPRVLVIMVSFADNDFTYTPADFDHWLNSTEYTTERYKSHGSAAQYFADSSNGKFRPVFDLKGPYKLPKSQAYYGENSGDDQGDQWSRYTEMIREACDMAGKAGTDLSQYDSDGDGCLDLVYVIYAGYGENTSGADAALLWPKSGYGNIGAVGGKQIFRYGISNELYGIPGHVKELGLDRPLLDGIGVFVHEMSHTLGLPDVYPYAEWDDKALYDNQSMEMWDVMDAGENTQGGFYPTPYTAWEREWMGWSDDMPAVSDNTAYALTPLADGGHGMRVANPCDATGNEFYVLENIPSGKNAGWYSYMPGKGLLITHIDYNADLFSNFSHPNDKQGKPRWTIIPANGTLYSSYRAQEPETSAAYLSAADIMASWKQNTYPNAAGVTAVADWREYNRTLPLSLHSITLLSDGTVTFKTGDGTTGITTPSHTALNSGTEIYTLDGRRAGRSRTALPHGVYVQGGRKFVK